MSAMPSVRLKDRKNVECPQCEGILTRCRGGGRTDEGLRLRRRRCDDCHLLFVTVEVPVMYPDGSPVPLTALDTDHRWYLRDRNRARVGFHSTGQGRRPFARSARLQVRISVTPPERQESAA